MTQVVQMPFEATRVSPAEVLQPWIQLLRNVTDDVELRAFRDVVEALIWDVTASQSYANAVFWMRYGGEHAVEQALVWFGSMKRDLEQASWQWVQAASWLQEYGDQQKEQLYQPLYQQVIAQQQRFAQFTEQLRLRVVGYCQEWGVPEPDWCMAS